MRQNGWSRKNGWFNGKSVPCYMRADPNGDDRSGIKGGLQEIYIERDEDSNIRVKVRGQDD
jgi:hypothetical protein